MALKVLYTGVSQVYRHRPLDPALGQLERHTIAADFTNSCCQPLGVEVEKQAIEVAGLNRAGLTWQIDRLLASPIKPVLTLDAKTSVAKIWYFQSAITVIRGASN